MQQLAKMLQESPDDSFLLFALAMEYWKIDEISKTRTLLERVYTLNPGYTGVYYHLAKLYVQINENKKAETMFNEGIERCKQKGEILHLNELLQAKTEWQLSMEDSEL